MELDTLNTNRTHDLTGFFDTKDAADRAKTSLVAAGFMGDGIHIVGGQTTDETVHGSEGKGLWASIKDFFLPDEERYTLEEGMRRGGYVLTLPISEADNDKAVEILDREGTVDMTNHEEKWRMDGWSGYQNDLAIQGVDNTVTSMPDAPLVERDVDQTQKRQQQAATTERPATMFRKPGSIDHTRPDPVNPVTDGDKLIPLLTEDLPAADKKSSEDIRLRNNIDERHDYGSSKTIEDGPTDVNEHDAIIRRENQLSNPSPRR